MRRGRWSARSWPGRPAAAGCRTPTRHALLRAYGIPVAPITTVHSEDDAVRRAPRRPGGTPVVLKADVPGLVHKSDAGAVLLDLRTEVDVRAGYRQLAGQFGARLHGVGVQPMITGGTEVMIGVADDQMFGPLVIFGLGGVATEVLADHSARLAPLTGHDADVLIDSIRSAPLLHGHHGTAGGRPGGAARRADAGVPARRRHPGDLRARPQPGHRPPRRRRRGGRPDQGHPAGAARSVPAAPAVNRQ